MKTPAVISALTVVGSIAFAAGQSQTSRVIPVEEKPLEGEMPPMMAMGKNCEPFPEEVWFVPLLRTAPTCSGRLVAVSTNFAEADVNRDGVDDFFVKEISTVGNPGGSIVLDGQPMPGWLIAQNRVDTLDGEPENRYVGVLKSDVVGSLIIERHPGAARCLSPSLNWRDMDGDGDLDLVIRLQLQSPEWKGYRWDQVWMENIGYEKPNPPLAADLNQDGTVDGIDLGMLLAAWGMTS